MNKKLKTQDMVTLGMLGALAYVVMIVGRFPLVPAVSFLKYDPKDVIITLAGMIYGPLSAFAVSFVVSFVEMLTVSDTGIIGLVMNVISTCSFACTASFIFLRCRKAFGKLSSVVGLIAGSICMVVVMILWNVLLTPLYMGWPRSAVIQLLVPGFLPFNLLKAGLNAAATLLLARPLFAVLYRSGLLTVDSSQKETETGRFPLGLLLLGLALLATCILIILLVHRR